MRKLILLLFTFSIFSCKSDKNQNVSNLNNTEISLNDAAIINSKKLIDSIFNLEEVLPDYILLKADSLSIEEIIEIKGKDLSILKEHPISRYGLESDPKYVDRYTKSIKEDINPNDSLLLYLVFAKTKFKYSVKEEYKDYLTEDQKIEVQDVIKASDKYYYFPNILTPDKKQYSPQRLKEVLN